MATQLTPLSAAVTRILSLTGFPKELKTKDIQAAFSEWENAMGGFRIKWLDDTSLLIVFNDAGIAKRAYLQVLAEPPAAIFDSENNTAVIKPYDGPDAQAIIQNVNSRHNSTASRGHNARASVSAPNGNGVGNHARMASTSVRNGSSKPMNGSIPEHPAGANGPHATSIAAANGSASHSSYGREPSPTLPSIPSQPTLNSMILSSTFGDEVILNDPAILAASNDATGNGPRIGDPGKRMLNAALGMKHPGLGQRSMSGGVINGAD